MRVRAATGHAAYRHAEGIGRLRGQLYRRGPDLLRRSGRAGARALALEIVEERLRLTGVQASEMRYDTARRQRHARRPDRHVTPEPYEVRIRVAGRTDSLREADAHRQ